MGRCALFWLLELNRADGKVACFYRKKWIQLLLCVESKQRLHMSNHSGVREHCSEHRQWTAPGRASTLAATWKPTQLPQLHLYFLHSWLSAVMWQSEVACNIIIYYTHDTELCTYSPALWLKPLLLTLTFPSCSDTAEQRLDCCCEVWKPFWYNRTC